MQNKNAFVYFILTLLLLGIVMLVFYLPGSDSTFRDADRDFSVDRSLDVSRIELTPRAESTKVVLHKDEQGRWKLNETLFANELAVNELLNVLSRIMVRQPVSLMQKQQVEEMLSKHGTEVSIFINTHRVKLGNMHLFPIQRKYLSFWVGEDTPDLQSTYMQKFGSGLAFKVHRPGYDSGIAYLFEADERVWRDPVVLDAKWDEIQSVRTEVTGHSGESYIVGNDPERTYVFYHFDNPQQELDFNADTTRVKRYLSSFIDLYYENLLDEEAETLRKELMAEQPFMQITVEFTDGNEIQFRTFARLATGDEQISGIGQDPNRFYLQVNEGEFAMAQYYVFNRILRPLSFFRK